MKRLLINLTSLAAAALAAASFIAGAAAAWLLLRYLGRDRQDELARTRRELAGQRTRAMEAERQLTSLQDQAAAPPTGSRGVLAADDVVSAEMLASEASTTVAQLETQADIQALDELTLASEPPIAEAEVLQASLETNETTQDPAGTDVAALVSRSGTVELLISDEEPVEDDLTRLEGIGPAYAGRLREHGIVTFARLARSSEDKLAGIIQAPAWRRPSFADWIAQARLAVAGDEAGLAALQDELFNRRGDNLTLIDGLGAKYATALHSGGIASFAALAAATPDQVAAIVGEAGLRNANFSAWIEEAAQRAAGKRVARRSTAAP